MNTPITAKDLQVKINHGQLYIYGVPPWAEDLGNDAVLRALDNARESGRYVGVADGLIDLLTPVQWNFDAPMRVEVWSQQPPEDDAWDHVVDVDLDLPDGVLHFEGSGGMAPIECGVNPGAYRARVAGRGYDEVPEAEGLDSYRIQLWTRDDSQPPELRKLWSGWERLT